jgi:hypothetical protein
VDHITTTGASTVTGAQANDVRVNFFASGQGATTGSVYLSNGVLYMVANNYLFNNFQVKQSGSNIVVTYNLGHGNKTATFNASDVHFLAGYGSSGVDTFSNNTAIGDSFVAGGGGSATLQGGKGFNQLDAGYGGTAYANGTYNDLSGTWSTLIGSSLPGEYNVFHNTDGTNALLNVHPKDLVIK